VSESSKLLTDWHSVELGQMVKIARWGHFGTPVLLFPTAGGDAEECERFLMIKVLSQLIDAGRIKVYSCDSVAGKAWTGGDGSPAWRSAVQNRFDSFIYKELVPAIRRDCNSDAVEIVTAGASIGAFNALATICRHPDVFKLAICMSGTYDLTRWLGSEGNLDFYYSSPVHYLPGLAESQQLHQLRQRFILLATGEGDYEDPSESWRAAQILGAKGVPNRVDPWGTEWAHNWVTWREMLPKYLDELVP
jgi:esterase/lipase superfamily enzyme